MKTKQNKIFLKGVIKINKSNDLITVIASDETLDRHGEVLPIENWDLSKFKMAPRMLVDHDHQVSSIVGKWLNPRIENNQLLMDADFHDITELSRSTHEMVDKGYLDTVSVGLIFHGPEKDGGHPLFELIETSWVTVPANPSARVVKSLMDKGLTTEETSKMKEYVEKFEDIAEEEAEEEVAEEEEEEEIPPEEDDFSDDEKVLKTAEEIKSATTETIRVERAFILKLIADSEKLLTLTQNSFQTRLMKESFKEAARMINHSLRELNKADRIIS